ncbi:MAG: IS1380 family transposase [Actinomycetota bacterium]
MSRLRHGGRGRRRVRLGAPDASLTGFAGLVVLDELVGRLGVVAALDAGVGRIKTRRRGLTGGQLLVGVASAQLTGAAWLSGLDRLRADAGVTLCEQAPVAASSTARSLARRIGEEQAVGVEAGLHAVYTGWLGRLAAQQRADLVTRAPTIDLDATDIEVYGRTKQRVGWNYAGVRCGRVHLASWANAELPLAVDLIGGDEDVRPNAPGLLRRALAVLPAAVCARPRVRADAGYFDAALAQAAVDAACDFAVAAKRNPAAWRAYRQIPDDAWVDAIGMPGAQVAACAYAPAGWPAGTHTVVRRVRLDADDLSADPRSRRRRTIDKDQLALMEAGEVDHGYAVSFIVTNIPANDSAIPGLEAWFRRRTSIEDRIREAKLGAGLLHLPSADHAVNRAWTQAAVLAGALNVMLHALTGPTHPVRHDGRVRITTLRAHLLAVPGRLIRHARGLTLRLPPNNTTLPAALARIRALPSPS